MRKIRYVKVSIPAVLSIVFYCGVMCAQEAVSSQTVVSENVETPETSDETATVHELQELVVQSRRAVIEGNKLVVIPTKSEKKLSDSPASLVDKMQFPGVRVVEDKITSIDGSSVAVFINGVRANDVDYRTFWPKNTVRVEYLINPLDPAFEGERHVMNFIVAEPKTGGVTRLSANQGFRRFGTYNASSKLVTGRMTYGFNFSGRYHGDDLYKEGEESYNDLWYGGEKYDKISRSYSGRQDFRLHLITTALNARYIKENLVMTHAVGINWDEMPDNNGISSQTWAPGLFNAPTVYTESSGHRMVSQVSGDYHVGVSELVWLHANWRYNYTDAHKSSGYAQEGYSPLRNGSKEKIHTFDVGFNPTVVKVNKWSVQVPMHFVANLYKTLYTGTASNDQNMDRYDFTGDVTGIWSITPYVTVVVAPGVAISSTKVAGMMETYASPTVTGVVQWIPGSKLNLQSQISYSVNNVSASDVNPVMTQITDLEWQMGNPYLKNVNAWTYYLTGNYLCSNTFTVSCNLTYTKLTNELLKFYTPNTPVPGGVVATYVNAGTVHDLLVKPNLNLRLFNGRINISVYPRYEYSHCNPVPSVVRTLSNFSADATVSATVKNVGLKLTYYSRSSYLTYAGFEKRKRPDKLGFSVSYGTGDFFCSLSFSNILHKKTKEYFYYSSPTYDRMETMRQVGRNVSVDLTYFFGYGKKTDRTIDVESVRSIPGSVM